MADVITCPQCQRRLTLPDEYRGKEVRCPACRTSFPSVPAGNAVNEEIPFVIPVDVPPGWNRAETAPALAPLNLEGAPSRRPKKKAGSSSWAVALAVLVMVGGGLMVFGGILFLIANSNNSRSPQSKQRVFADDTRERQAVLDAFHAQAPVPEDEIAAQVRPVLDALRATCASASIAKPSSPVSMATASSTS